MLVQVALTALVAGLYALGALLPFWFLTSPEAGAAFFPAAGLTVSVLLLTPRRTWPRWLLVIGVTEMAVDLTHGQSMGKALGFALANTLEPLVGAILVQWAFGRRHRTLREGLIGFLVCAAAIGPVVGATLGATTAVVLGEASEWWSVAGNWWLGDALGVLVLATPILAWSRRSPYEPAISTTEIAGRTPSLATVAGRRAGAAVAPPDALRGAPGAHLGRAPGRHAGR